MSTGPLPAGTTQQLESLKQLLITMRPDDLSAPDAEAIAVEISAIRLQLKRLAADRDWLADVGPRAPQD